MPKLILQTLLPKNPTTYQQYLRQDLKQRLWGVLLTVLLSMAHSVCFFIQLKITYPGVEPPKVG